uniref:CBY1 interacting BAR domain containing 1 n=1 Tax=Corvus moneduloides TaxID=1196302 RepID=A0A8C3DCH9_CORMO
MMLLGRGLDARDNQTRQIQDAVSNVEKHFGELCQIFAGYVRKTARLRDKADLLVNEIYAYAATETPNLKVGLKNFADEFSRLQDYRQAEVDRLEAKVVEPLKCYGTIVKLKRDDLKATLTAKHREAKQLSQLEKTRQRNPSDLHIIYQAENELHRATLETTRTTRHLEETIDNFEKKKIKDIKNIFSEFITIEMLFHGKALEIYTAAYQNIQNIDENEDLEVRVIKICFSVYFLYKKQFSELGYTCPMQKNATNISGSQNNRMYTKPFFSTFSVKAYMFIISEQREQLQWQSNLFHKIQKRDSQNYLPLQTQLITVFKEHFSSESCSKDAQRKNLTLL